MNKRKKINWLTPDYFIDCDFNYDVLREILVEYDIYWVILLPRHNARFVESDFNNIKDLDGLIIEFKYSEFRQRDPRRMLLYKQIVDNFGNRQADVTYINLVPDIYFIPFFWILKKSTTVFCAHDGGVHQGFDFRLLNKISFNLTYPTARYICMFSKSESALFHDNFPRPKIFQIPLALKSFGNAFPEQKNDIITFLSFGVINYSKNIELLIAAACNVYERGYKNFRISINGRCNNWDDYSALIKYPQIFDCDIRTISNNEIASIFSSAHYFVQPYRHVSQSGAMKVAFNYNLPVLASNFPGFANEIVEGVNGYLFDSSDVSNLEDLMIRVIEEHGSNYNGLRARMKRLTEEVYSADSIGKKYLSMFNEIVDASRQ